MSCRTTATICRFAAHLAWIAAGLWLALIASHLPARATEGAEVRLIEHVSIKGPIIRLSDLFKNAGANGNKAVFRAPDPGKTGHVPVERIIKVGQTNGLYAIETPSFRTVTISRTSRVISAQELLQAIRTEVTKRRPLVGNEQVKVECGNCQDEYHIASDDDGEMQIDNFSWMPRSGTFNADINFGSDNRLNINGKARIMVEVTVAKQSIAAGSILTAAEIENRLISSNMIRINDPAPYNALIGQSAKRRLTAGTPIALSDIEAPKLILNNQLVTIVLEMPGLILRAEGKALSDASEGETLKVMNTQSKRVINATAKGPGLVTVTLNQASASGS